MRVLWDQSYTLDSDDDDTTTKSAFIASVIADRPGVELEELADTARDTGIGLLADTHDEEYILSVVTGDPLDLAESSGLRWTEVDTYRRALAHAAGVVEAVRIAEVEGVAGTLSSGLHHARPDSGGGFCTFNGLAMAAYDWLCRETAPLAILDLDAHCGGGTIAHLADKRFDIGVAQVMHFDLSTNPFDEYTDLDYWEGARGWHHPVSQLAFADPYDYLDSVEAMLDLIPWDELGMLIYNAGMDPLDDGVSANALAVREELVFGRAMDASVPVAWTLAGGYTHNIDMDELVRLHTFTVDSAVATAAAWA